MGITISPQQHALLRRSRNGVLATVGPDRWPHAGPVWYLWDGAEIRISTPRTTRKVRDIELQPRVAFCVDDQVAGEYLTLYGYAAIIADERVTELTRPLLLAYLPPDEATARWNRINADGSRVVILLRPARVAGREQVRLPPRRGPHRGGRRGRRWLPGEGVGNDTGDVDKRSKNSVELRGFEPLTFCMPSRPNPSPDGPDAARRAGCLQ
jgi:PPOX class probable F420-dependent enzyme